MSVVYSMAVKNARMNAVVSALDAGSGNAVLVIGTTSMAATLATVTLAKPSATVSNGVLTFSGLPKNAVASGAGTAAIAQLRDSDGTIIVDNLTVGTSGTNVLIDNAEITVGEAVNFNNTSTITHG